MVSKDIDIHRDIVEQCRQGRREAFAQLYRLYSKAMFNICLRMLGDRGLAEDVLQESFADAFQQIREFRQESTFGAWLKKIVVFKCITEMKRKKEELTYMDDLEPVDAPENETGRPEEYELALMVENVKKAVSRLPDGSRTIFSLYLLEGYDHTEIAQILNISESTSKSQYMRARLKVKEILTTYAHEGR